MKEILTNKGQLEDSKIINISKNCNAILQNKIPLELNNLGAFTILYMIGITCFKKVLCDLGASINLMFLSMF